MPQSSLTEWLKRPGSVDGRNGSTHPISGQNIRKATATTSPSHGEKAAECTSDGKQHSSSRPTVLNPKQAPLSPNVELRACTKDDLSQLKHLTGLLLPIPYPDKFFKEIIEDEVTSSITLLAVWHDDPLMKGREKGRLVGAIRCRLLNQSSSVEKRDGSPMLYLSTLTLLSPYRGHGIATQLLRVMARRAVENHGITTIGAHVWEANTDALLWYQKRGFREVRREDGYYRRLDPQVAIVLERDIGVMDLLGE